MHVYVSQFQYKCQNGGRKSEEEEEEEEDEEEKKKEKLLGAWAEKGKKLLLQ